MWKLKEVQAEHIRQATAVHVEVREPVVVLAGPSRAGKTSTLQAISAAICGKAMGPRGALAQASLKNPAWGNGWAGVTFERGGEEFAVARYFAASVTATINGTRTRTLGEAGERVQATLGATPEQLYWLAGGHDLIFAQPLAQAEVLCNTLGLDVALDRAPADGVLPGLLQRLNGHEALGRTVLGALSRRGGWPLLSEAQAAAEDARLEASRKLERAEGALEAAETAMKAALTTARVPDLSSLVQKHQAATAELQRAEARVQELEAAGRTRAEAESARAFAEEAQATAEAAVQRAQAAIEDANARREEVAARRAALVVALDNARDAREGLQEQVRMANQRRTAREQALAELQEALATAPVTYACPGCEERVGLVDGALVLASELPAVGATQAEVDEARAALPAAEKALEKARAAAAMSGAEIAQLEAELAQAPELASPELLRERLEEAVAASDEAEERLTELSDQPLPAAVTPQELEAARAAVGRAHDLLTALSNASGTVEAHGAAVKAQVETKAARAELDALVGRLREVTREVAAEVAAPVIEGLSAMLGKPIVFDPEVGLGEQVALGGDESLVRPLSEGCTGERLQASAALQGVLAAHLGVGMALVDEFSGLDPDHARLSIEEMQRVSAATGVVWVLTTAQDLPEMQGVQVVRMDGGYSDEAAAPAEKTLETAMSAK